MSKSNISINPESDLLIQESARKVVREELQIEAKEMRKDFITIFGLYAALLTFTVLQIQSLIQAKRISLIMGASSFFVASSLTFIFALHHLFHDKSSWSEFRRPIFIIILVIYFFSFECFWYSSHSGKFWLF